MHGEPIHERAQLSIRQTPRAVHHRHALAMRGYRCVERLAEREALPVSPRAIAASGLVRPRHESVEPVPCGHAGYVDDGRRACQRPQPRGATRFWNILTLRGPGEAVKSRPGKADISAVHGTALV